MKIRTEKIDGVTHHYIETGRKVLLEEIATLKTERANLDAYIVNIKKDGAALRNTINEKDILLAQYQKQIEIDKQLLAQEQQKVLKEQEEKKQLSVQIESWKQDYQKLLQEKELISKKLVDSELILLGIKKELEEQKKHFLEISTIHTKKEEEARNEIVFLRKKLLDNDEMLDMLKLLILKRKMSVDSFEAGDITKAFLGEKDLHDIHEETLEKKETSILGDETKAFIGD